MTPSQLQTLHDDIVADSTLNSFPNNSDGNTAIQAIYKVVASPDYWVWRSFVPDAEIYEVTTADATAWSWSIYIARSQAEREAWRQMVNMRGGLNASLANVRQGIADIFSGAGGAAQRTHLTTIGRRKASRSEKLFATGSGTTGSPSVMAVEGELSIQDIEAARNLP